MKDDTGSITYYDLVELDRATGRRRVVPREQPVRGRYQAQTELERVQRSNRNPNLQYSLERRTRRDPDRTQILEAQNLLTHKFGRH